MKKSAASPWLAGLQGGFGQGERGFWLGKKIFHWPILLTTLLGNRSPPAMSPAAQEQKAEYELRTLFRLTVEPCPGKWCNDGRACPFVHRGESRRDPRRFSYSSKPCEDFSLGSCPKGDDCEFAHGYLEIRCYPSVLRPCGESEGLEEAWLRRYCMLVEKMMVDELSMGSPDTESTHNLKGNASLWPVVIGDYLDTQDPNGTGTGLAIACDNGGAYNVVNGYTLNIKDCFRAPLNGGSPGPKLCQFRSDGAAFDNIKKRIEDHVAAVFTTERIGLVLDSGASMHAVGEARIMQGIRFYSFDKWATLPDDSALPIIGIGTIEMNGFSIPNVSLVDGLRNNLISVSQLDKDHGMCCCFYGGQCKVMLPDGTVVGGAILEEDGLYKLRFLEVPHPEE